MFRAMLFPFQLAAWGIVALFFWAVIFALATVVAAALHLAIWFFPAPSDIDTLLAVISAIIAGYYATKFSLHFS